MSDPTAGQQGKTGANQERGDYQDIGPGPTYDAEAGGAQPARTGPPSPRRSDRCGTHRPPAPGARHSPQIPGQVPDQFRVPSQRNRWVQKVAPEALRRPLTQYGSAEEIMGIFTPRPDGPAADDPTRFELGEAAYEELRKADPSLLTPVRPRPGNVLDSAPTATASLGAGHGDAGSDQVPNQNEGRSTDVAPQPGAPVGDPAASPSDATTGASEAALGGALPAEKDGETNIQPASGDGPPVAPQ